MTDEDERATQWCRSSLSLELPASDAFELFTPEGERSWAHGWAPTYHSSAPDRSSPGTVFTTEHGARVTTWVVVAREPGRRMLYARVDDLVGTVEVVLHGASAERTTVEVEYVLTPTTAAAQHRLGGVRSRLRRLHRRLADRDRALSLASRLRLRLTQLRSP